jgi:hypothetical protein
LLKIFTLFTTEVDDPKAAVSDIALQLERQPLLKNTVGFFSCHADSIHSDVARAVCASLPFETVGTTTLANMLPDSSEEILLSFFVLTSDEAHFVTGLSQPILGEDEGLLRDAYKEAEAKLAGTPTFMLSVAPLLMNVGGDFFVDTLSKVSNGISHFGTVTIDHTLDYPESRVIHNGAAYENRFAFILASGIRPDFIVTSVQGEKSLQDKGVVTASTGNQLISVNNLSVLDYLVGLGILTNDSESLKTINMYPFIVDYKDGTTPVARVIFAFTPEGAAVCGGSIPVGTVLKVGSIDAQEVVSSTQETLTKLTAKKRINGILMFSCIARYYTPGFSPISEMETVRDLMAKTDIPYHYTISGGEFCPVYNLDKTVSRNRNHNYTIVLCVF